MTTLVVMPWAFARLYVGGELVGDVRELAYSDGIRQAAHPPLEYPPTRLSIRASRCAVAPFNRTREQARRKRRLEQVRKDAVQDF